MSTGTQWLVTVQGTGMLVSETVLISRFKDGPIELDNKKTERFKRMWNRFQVNIEKDAKKALRKWIDFVLQDFLEIEYNKWATDGESFKRLRVNLLELQQSLAPKRALIGEDEKPILLVMEFPIEKALNKPETTTSRWRAAPTTKMERLLRETGCKIGLITNGAQLGIVYSTPGLTSTNIIWDMQDLVDEPDSLEQFYTLLRQDSFLGPNQTRLESLAQESQRRQIDVTDQLGNQVLSAIETFIEHVDKCDWVSEGNLLSGVSPDDIYEMALITMVRLIFIFYSEERGLLPHGHPFYDSNYGISHLIYELEGIKRETPEYLEESTDAWERILATIRLIYHGSPHQDIVLKAYGGNLFNPERFPTLESKLLSIPNSVIYQILRSLSYSETRVGGRRISQRVSFRTLDVEQIGSVYEQLMEYRCIRAIEDLVVFIGGKDPIRPKSEFISLNGKKLLTYIIQLTNLKEEEVRKRLKSEPNTSAKENLPCELMHLHGVIEHFIYRAGHLYVNQSGDSRKATGSYYTPKEITNYLIKECLKNKILQSDGRPENPHKILAIKICDPAMGSGAFLVQAARYLAEKLVESWTMIEVENPDIPLSIPYGSNLEEDPLAHPMPNNPEEAYKLALRLVTEKCLYGVDKNPLAVDIAKASLWLITLSKDLPLTFLDHHLRCGDSLVGANYQLIEAIPTRPLPASKKKDNDMILKSGTSFLSSFSFEELKETLNLLHVNLSTPTMSILERDRKETLIQDLLNDSSSYMMIKKIMDLWTSVWFWDSNDSEFEVPHTNEFLSMMQSILECDDIVSFNNDLSGILTHVFHLYEMFRFFHWQLEFPSVFNGETPGFDVIIGNPPYGLLRKIITDSKTRNQYNNYYDYIFRFQKGNRNLYKLFLERCTHLLAESGSFGMIFPSAFFGETSSTELRSHLFENCIITNILQFPESTQVFSGVTQDVSILTYHNSSSSSGEYKFRLSSQISEIELQNLSSINFIEISLKELANMTQSQYNTPTFEFPDIEWKVLSHVMKYPPLGSSTNDDALAEVYEGHLHETSDRIHMSEERTSDLLVKGIHLKRYYVDLREDGPQPRWLKDKAGFFDSKPAAKRAASLKKIIGKSTINKQSKRRMQFSILDQGFVVTNNVKFLVVSNDVLPGFLLAILNSGFSEWFISKFAATNRITNYEIENIPIPRCSSSIEDLFDRLTSLIISQKIRQQSDNTLQSKIKEVDLVLDACVYELYFNLKSGLVKHLRNSMKEISNKTKDSRKIFKLIESPETKSLVKDIFNNNWVRCIIKVLYNRGISNPILSNESDN